ncbi:MAG: hypothetical protein ACYTFA_13815 [Planctomycetota bacterium]
MFTKRSLIVLLTGLNVLLLIILLIGSYSLPAVYAQVGGGRPGDWLAVTAKAQGQAYDALYLLNRQDDKLYVLYPTSVQQKQYEAAAFRDLKRDFQRED